MLKEKGVIYSSKHTWQLTIDKIVVLYEELSKNILIWRV